MQNLIDKLQQIKNEKNKIVPSIIKAGTNIFGVEGSLESGSVKLPEPIHIHKDAVSGPTIEITCETIGNYGFEKIGNIYKSTNTGIDSSTCSSIFHILSDIDCVLPINVFQSSENNFDYGNIDGISYMGKDGNYIQEIELAGGVTKDILVTYIKDGSASNGQDIFSIIFDIDSIGEQPEFNADVNVLQYISKEAMLSDNTQSDYTLGICYDSTESLLVNIYQWLNSKWQYVGVANSKNFKHSNIVRGIVIGDMIGSYIDSRDTGNLSYDPDTGNLVKNININIGWSFLTFHNCKIVVDKINSAKILVSYSSNKDVNVTNKTTNNTYTFVNTNGEIEDVEIPSIFNDTIKYNCNNINDLFEITYNYKPLTTSIVLSDNLTNIVNVSESIFEYDSEFKRFHCKIKFNKLTDSYNDIIINIEIGSNTYSQTLYGTETDFKNNIDNIEEINLNIMNVYLNSYSERGIINFEDYTYEQESNKIEIINNNCNINKYYNLTKDR